MSLKKYLPLLLSLLTPLAAFADASAPGVVNSGDTAWMLASTALVLIMTPGLAFFYAGMVRTKNVVSTLYQNFIALGVVGDCGPSSAIASHSLPAIRSSAICRI